MPGFLSDVILTPIVIIIFIRVMSHTHHIYIYNYYMFYILLTYICIYIYVYITYNHRVSNHFEVSTRSSPQPSSFCSPRCWALSSLGHRHDPWMILEELVYYILVYEYVVNTYIIIYCVIFMIHL